MWTGLSSRLCGEFYSPGGLEECPGCRPPALGPSWMDGFRMDRSSWVKYLVDSEIWAQALMPNASSSGQELLIWSFGGDRDSNPWPFDSSWLLFCLILISWVGAWKCCGYDFLVRISHEGLQSPPNSNSVPPSRMGLQATPRARQYPALGSPDEFGVQIHPGDVERRSLRADDDANPARSGGRPNPRLVSTRIRNEHRRQLLAKADGAGLKEAPNHPPSHRWITAPNPPMPGAAYIGAIKVRGNLAATGQRAARSRRGQGFQPCDAGCGRPETLGHISQTCTRTHLNRTARHDKALNQI